MMSQAVRFQQNFPSTFEEADIQLVKNLRQKVKSDVKNAERAKIFYCFDKYHQFSICLPPLNVYPERFRQLYHIQVCDLDMKHELKSAKIINWCDIAKKLNPVKTTADGNCLLHAVSLFVWGFEDNELFLRRMLYACLCSEKNNSLKRRWAHNQHQLRQQHPSEFNYTVTSDEIDLEWEDVKKAASDTFAGSTSTGLPYSTLEGIHIYALANIFARPIIVLGDKSARSAYGQSMQENYLYGIYLPLEWDSHDTCRSPIVIGYHMNHFAPLVTHSDTPDGRGEGQNVLPIWMHDQTPLPVRYTLPEEERSIPDIMKRYLKVKSIPRSSSSSVGVVTSVISEHLSIYDIDDIVTVHRKLCELIYTQTEPHHGSNLPGSVQPKHPVNRKSPSQQNNGVKCVTENCDMFGSPMTNFLCSECFNKYTVEYNMKEAEQRGNRLNAEPSAPPLSMQDRINESYVDISMMGENCQNHCGNRCSTKTYPYCHECWPLFNQAQPEEEAIQSMTLHNTTEIAKQRRMNIENDKVLFGQGNEEEAKRPAPTLATNDTQSSGAEKANLHLHVESHAPARPEVIHKNDAHTMIPGTELPSMPSDISNEPASQTYVMVKSPSSEGTPSPRTQSSVQFPGPNQNEANFSERVGNESIPVGSIQPSSSETEIRKQLCAKAGCRGTRLDNNYGYCLECWKDSFNLPSTVESRVSLSTVEIHDINPVITTSKQKKKCASPLCNKRIYPPSSLCNGCIRILSDAHNTRARSLENYNNDTEDETARAAAVTETIPPIVPMQTPKPSNTVNARHCVEPNCDNFGDPNMLERCTYHYRKFVGTGHIAGPPPNTHRYMTPQEVEQSNIAERDPVGPLLTGHFRPVQHVRRQSQEQRQQTQSSGQQQRIPNFQSAMYNVENMMKNPLRCKSRGCSNFSNSKKKGYCNQCYDSLVRRGIEPGPQREEHTCC